MSSLNQRKILANKVVICFVLFNFALWPITFFNLFALSSAIAMTCLTMLLLNELMDRHLDTLNSCFEKLYQEYWTPDLYKIALEEAVAKEEELGAEEVELSEEQQDPLDENYDRRKAAEEEEARFRDEYEKWMLEKMRHRGFDAEADELERLEEETEEPAELFEGEEKEELFVEEEVEEEPDPDADLIEIDLSKIGVEEEEEVVEIIRPKFSPGARLGPWTVKRSYPKLEYNYRSRTCKISTNTIQDKVGIHFFALLGTSISVSLPEQKKSFKMSIARSDAKWRQKWKRYFYLYYWVVFKNMVKDYFAEKKSSWNKRVDKYEGMHTYGFPRIAKSWDKGELLVRQKDVDILFKVESVGGDDEAWLFELFNNDMLKQTFASKLTAFDAILQLKADSLSYTAEFEIGDEATIESVQQIVAGMYMLLEKMDHDSAMAAAAKKEAAEHAAALAEAKAAQPTLMEKMKNWGQVYRRKYSINKNVDKDGRRLN